MTIVFDTLTPCHPECVQVEVYLFKGIGHIIGLDGKKAPNQCATICLDKYRTTYREKLNRRRHRLEKKCNEKGYIFERFEYSNYVPDIVEINTSKDFRSGGELKEHYKYTVEQRGGYPQKLKPIIQPVCNLHHRNIWHGVFLPKKGYKQGNIVTNQKLVCYNGIAVCGEIAIYSWNIGHGEYLQDGIMTKLTIETINFLLLEHPEVKYFVMGNWTDGLGVGPGLQQFKIEHLFEPLYLIRK